MQLALILMSAGALLLLSILASKASIKLGVPALVLFIGLGMLIGSDGLGGIQFDDALLTRDIGTVALAFILFAGGLETKWLDIRPVLLTGISLATLGVIVTGSLIGVAACMLLGFPPYVGLLLGAIVSSTDAAAVFSVLRARNIHLKSGLAPLLELESGSNDPMAVFLTTSLTALALNPAMPLLPLLPSFAIQMVLGVLVGYILGTGAAWFINRLKLEYAGLYPAVTIGFALLSFGGAELIHGNAFLSVYVCGLALGNRNFLHRQSLMHFHDGLAWLVQIAMFLVLGLQVFPSELIPIAGSALLISALLVFVARPLAVLISTAGARWMTFNDRLFVSWTGLRGAVPIILATIPLTAGVPQAKTIFNVVFFAVLTSIMVQGTFIDKVAKFLKVTVPGSVSVPHNLQNTSEILLTQDSPATGKHVLDLNLPRWALLLLVTREGTSFVPQGSTVLVEGDIVLLATRKEDLVDLMSEIGGAASVGAQELPV
ncbi:MAG: potassium/proton antiporter [Fimbriimonas sp.]